MDTHLFWDIINKSKALAADNQSKHKELLINRLIQLPYQEIFAFHAIFHFYLKMADKRKIFAAAGIMNCGMDDSFLYFRAWLISCGETVYKNTFLNPDNLADIAETRDEKYSGYEFEDLLYIADGACEKKHEIDKEDYWLTYGQPEEYELDPEQIAVMEEELVFAPDLDDEAFVWNILDLDDDELDEYEELEAKSFPRLLAIFG